IAPPVITGARPARGGLWAPVALRGLVPGAVRYRLVLERTGGARWSEGTVRVVGGRRAGIHVRIPGRGRFVGRLLVLPTAAGGDVQLRALAAARRRPPGAGWPLPAAGDREGPGGSRSLHDERSLHPRNTVGCPGRFSAPPCGPPRQALLCSQRHKVRKCQPIA